MKGTKRRKLDVLVLSDIHLGTYGCHAKDLLLYLKTVRPKTVVLNGDIIDVWQFSKSYWPKSHARVIKHLLGWITKGTKVYYVTGNHDEMLRKFAGLKLGSLRIVNKIVLDMEDGKKAWFFHGDVFDVTMQHSKWLAKLGAIGYDMLILINRFVNFISEKVFGRGKLSLSKKIKNSVKSAVKFINDFEKTATDIAISKGYSYVACGHIHQPEIKDIENEKGKVTYLNSGDWIENLTALEYENGQWKLYKFDEQAMSAFNIEEVIDDDMNDSVLFDNVIEEFNAMRQ